MKIYNYLFYRVAGYYLNRWRDIRGSVNGITLVTLIQLSHLASLEILLSIFFKEMNSILFEQFENKPFMEDPKVLIVSILIYGLNMYKYLSLRKYEYYKEKWKDEDKSLKKKRGWLIILFVLLTFAITVTLAIYRKNLV